ncbi:neutrophil gelatinase-associated lipocalin [Castor canadensis]|uniref:Neutrophil gelatinase-associated lipocalin n=1 Tax=Castor canadensis TaxID=51338 RepID=A0AC58KUY2_CASCN
MSQCLLWLGLTLLGVLQTQVHGSGSDLIPLPPLDLVPVQAEFREDLFQGKWYIIALAGNAVQKKLGSINMFTTTYHLTEGHSYNVTNTLIRDNQTCSYWTRAFVPVSQPAEFTMGNIENFPHIKNYLMRVTATDYNHFAIMFFKKTAKMQNKETDYFKTSLYGRTKDLPVKLKERFIQFANMLGLTNDHVLYPVPTDHFCIDN